MYPPFAKTLTEIQRAPAHPDTMAFAIVTDHRAHGMCAVAVAVTGIEVRLVGRDMPVTVMNRRILAPIAAILRQEGRVLPVNPGVETGNDHAGAIQP